MKYYYCHSCECPVPETDTIDYYAPGFPSHTGARGCDVCGSKVVLIDDDDIDPSIFDYIESVNS